jgi:hypothetical protein
MLESHLPILKRFSPFAALNETDLETIVVQGPSSPKIGMVGAYLLNENGIIAYVLEQQS